MLFRSLKWKDREKEKQKQIEQIEMEQRMARECNEHERLRCEENGVQCNFGICDECKEWEQSEQNRSGGSYNPGLGVFTACEIK